MRQSQPMLQSHRRCGHPVVWCLRDKDQQVNLFMIDIIVSQKFFCGSKAKVRRTCFHISKTTFLNPRLVNNVICLLGAEHIRVLTILDNMPRNGSRHRSDADALILYKCHFCLLLIRASGI